MDGGQSNTIETAAGRDRQSPSPPLSDLRADVHRYYGRSSFGLIVKASIAERCFRPVATLRLCQSVARHHGPARLCLPLCKFLHRLSTWLAGMDLSWQAQIGAGFRIVHGWGLVISPGARIGSNVTAFHGVTVGRRERIGADGRSAPEYPVIEDDVWLGPHCIVVGGVRIGRGSRIAGGAFIGQDVPPRSLAMGNPAVVVKPDCEPDVAQRAPV